MNSDRRVLIDTIDNENELSLFVTDDGIMMLSTPRDSHILVSNEIVVMQNGGYIEAYVYGNSGPSFMYRIPAKSYRDVKGFIYKWNKKELLLLKDESWNNFKKYFLLLFAFLEKKIDMQNINLRYEIGADKEDKDDMFALTDTLNVLIIFPNELSSTMASDDYFKMCYGLENEWLRFCISYSGIRNTKFLSNISVSFM